MFAVFVVQGGQRTNYPVLDSLSDLMDSLSDLIDSLNGLTDSLSDLTVEVA